MEVMEKLVVSPPGKLMDTEATRFPSTSREAAALAAAAAQAPVV
jgi:hypothetical protein